MCVQDFSVKQSLGHTLKRNDILESYNYKIMRVMAEVFWVNG